MSNQFVELTKNTLEEYSRSVVRAMAERIAFIMEALNNAGEKKQITIGDFNNPDIPPLIIRGKNIGYRCSEGCTVTHPAAWWKNNVEDTTEEIMKTLLGEQFKKVARRIHLTFENPEKAIIQFGPSPFGGS